jgi:hypothetical protein
MQPAQLRKQAGCLTLNLHHVFFIYIDTLLVHQHIEAFLSNLIKAFQAMHAMKNDQAQMPWTGFTYLLSFLYPRYIANAFDEWCSNFIPIKCDKSPYSFFCRDCKSIESRAGTD